MMTKTEELWWSECGRDSCGVRVEIFMPLDSTKAEVKEAFAAVGIKVLPCLCKKCNKGERDE